MSLFAVVPVKNLRETKSRLMSVLNPPGRAGLTLYMMGRVIAALQDAGIGEICVVSPDRLVLQKAHERGVSVLHQKSQGLNPALEEGREFALERGASAVLVLPADLPLIEAEDVRAVISGREDGVSAVISPNSAHSGTNALLLQPPNLFPFTFGPGSFEAHRKAAEDSGARVAVCERPHLAFDLDTEEDFAHLKTAEFPLP